MMGKIVRVLCVVLPLFLTNCAARQHLSLEFLSPVPDAEAVGVFHEVQQGETLLKICKLYGADLQEVAELNDITEPSILQVGQRIFIPDVSGPLPQDSVEPDGSIATPVPEETRKIKNWEGEFIWPVEGTMSSQFGVRRGRRHDGIDIAAPQGTEIHAAADGTVIFSGNHRDGYGNLVIIKHKKNLITIYAHAKKNLVKEGEEVKQGQLISTVGKTGRASGSHVHFEIREGVKPRNPLFFLQRPE